MINNWFVIEIVCMVSVVVLGLVLGYITTHGTKSQWIRIIDVFVIGPLMIYLGYYTLTTQSHQILTSNKFIQFVAILVIFFGATTITYNLRNYLFENGIKI